MASFKRRTTIPERYAIFQEEKLMKENIPKDKIEGVPSLFSLTDKVAIVTGGSKGLGRGIGLAMAAAGSHVVPVSRTLADLEDVAEEVRSLGRRSIPVVADVTQETQVQSMVQSVMEEFGRIDILVCSAGTVLLKPTPEYTVEEWRHVIRTNLESIFLCNKEVGKVMIRQKSGKIINMSSVRGLQGRANDPTYTTSKGGLNLMTKSLAIEWAPHGINVNAIAPTFIRTNLNVDLLDDPDFYKWVVSRIPMGRVGNIWDLFGAAVFLASSASDFITGHILYVDGGWTSA